MNVNPRPKLAFHITEAVYAVIVILWYVLPFISKEHRQLRPAVSSPKRCTALRPRRSARGSLVTVLSYLIPLICLWKIASFFLSQQVPVSGGSREAAAILLNLLSSGIVVTLVILHLVSRAASAQLLCRVPAGHLCRCRRSRSATTAISSSCSSCG